MSSEANKLGDTYLDAGSDSDEGQQAMDDIDAFEHRLRGEAAPAAALKTAATTLTPVDRAKISYS